MTILNGERYSPQTTSASPSNYPVICVNRWSCPNSKRFGSHLSHFAQRRRSTIASCFLQNNSAWTIMENIVKTASATIPTYSRSQRMRIPQQCSQQSWSDNRQLPLSTRMCIAIGLLVACCCGVAVTNGAIVPTKTESGVIQINVTSELIDRVAKQREQLLLSESQRLQQRGNGGEKAVAPQDHKTVKQKPKPDQPATHHKNPSQHPTHGRKYKTPETRQSDSPTLGKKEPCQPLPPALLRQILGAAFNPRYMSIDKPDWEDSSERTGVVKDGQNDQEWPSEPRRRPEAFHVHGGYTRILHDEPIPLLSNGTVRGPLQYMDMLEQDGGEEKDESNEQTTRTNHPHRHHHGKNGHGHHNKSATTVKSSTPNRTRTPSQILSQSKADAEAHFKTMTFEQVDQSPDYQSDAAKPVSGSDKFLNLVRSKRTIKSGFPWSCESKIKWIDLGPNHFPRFLRSVVCTSERCWFGHFQCRPKAFTVKILRRRKDSCEASNDEAADQPKVPSPSSELADEESPADLDGEEMFDVNSRVPYEFREQWVFEERAVTFCCECAA